MQCCPLAPSPLANFRKPSRYSGLIHRRTTRGILRPTVLPQSPAPLLQQQTLLRRSPTVPEALRQIGQPCLQQCRLALPLQPSALVKLDQRRFQTLVTQRPSSGTISCHGSCGSICHKHADRERSDSETEAFCMFRVESQNTLGVPWKY